jgi:hypothetical protein
MVWIGWMIGSLNRQQAKEFAVSPHFFHVVCLDVAFFAYFFDSNTLLREMHDDWPSSIIANNRSADGQTQKNR